MQPTQARAASALGQVNSALVDLNIAHIRSDGGVDPSFAADADETVHALAVSGSTVYAGGDFTVIGGQSRNHIAALSASTGSATGRRREPQPHCSARRVERERDQLEPERQLRGQRACDLRLDRLRRWEVHRPGLSVPFKRSHLASGDEPPRPGLRIVPDAGS